MKRGVFITFDVECSMGGAWYDSARRPVPFSRGMMGRYGRHQYGLPLIVDILSQHDLTGTFFLEAFNDELGHPGKIEYVCKYLMDRGQDVQLHIHPVHQQYGRRRRGLPHRLTDDIADLSGQEQTQLLEEACRRYRQWTGRMPVAFRAGNMGASESIFGPLSEVGIHIDSSYAFPYVPYQCRFSPENPYNGSRWYGRVLEVALSGFYQPRLPGLKPAKPLDLVGLSFQECHKAVEAICRADADAMLILHSFSLFKVRNAQYDGGRPNRIVTDRFRRMCQWLAGNADTFPTYTFSQLAEAIADGRYEANAVAPPYLGGVRPLVRKAVQAWNNLYWT